MQSPRSGPVWAGTPDPGARSWRAARTLTSDEHSPRGLAPGDPNGAADRPRTAAVAVAPLGSARLVAAGRGPDRLGRDAADRDPGPRPVPGRRAVLARPGRARRRPRRGRAARHRTGRVRVLRLLAAVGVR